MLYWLSISTCGPLVHFKTLRILNNIIIVGISWAQIHDSADKELRTTKNTHECIRPISKLFLLGVTHIHELCDSDFSVLVDWLDFLMEDKTIEIIQDLHGTLEFLQ